MRRLLILCWMLCALSAEAATVIITNWSQFPTAVPGSGDVILMQKGGINYYFTPNQLAVHLATNESFLEVIGGSSNSNALYSIIIANGATASNGLFLVETTRNGAVSNGVVTWVGAVSNAVVALIGSGSATNAIGNLNGAGTNTTIYNTLTVPGQAVVTKISRPQPSSVRAIGDSFTAGSGASSLTNSFVSLIAVSNAWTITNAGVSSRGISTFGYNAASYVVKTNELNFLMTGYNDMRQWGTTSAGQLSYLDGLYGLITFLALPEQSKLYFSTNALTNPYFTQTGTWENHNAYYTGRNNAYSETVNSKQTFDLYGQTIYVGYTLYPGAIEGIFSVTVDGTLFSSINTSNHAAPAEGFLFWPAVARISNLSETNHRVVINIEAGKIALDWVGSSAGINSPSSPKVYSAGTVPMMGHVYSAGAPYNIGNAAAVLSFQQMHNRVVSELASDGLGVVGVDAHLYFSSVTNQLHADFVHPNDAGHQNLALAFLDAFNGIPTVRDRQGARYGNTLSGLLYRDRQRLGIATATPSALVDIYGSPGASAVPIFHAGTNYLTGLTVATNGNVSIGDAFADARLDVESLTTQLQLTYDADTYVRVTVSGGGVTTFVSEDSGTGDGFAFEQTVDVAYVPATQTTYDLLRAINNSTTSGAAAGIWGIVGGQNVGGIAFIHNGTVSDSGSTALLYANGSGMAEGMRVAHTTGNVGIGTTAPLDKLHVVGGIVQTNGGIWQTWSLGAPSAPATQGAVYWNDGTNICAVFRNAAGALSTNKLSMTAWP